MKKSIKVSFVVILTFLFCVTLLIASSSAQNSPQTRVGFTELISITSDGTQGNLESYASSISANGRYVVFTSIASNLVPDDTNNSCDTDNDAIYDDNCPDVFVHDRVTGETARVSVASDGMQGNSTSGFSWSGYYTWFNYGSPPPSISADGRYVVFASLASNLVLGDTNGVEDIFMHDRLTGETARVSVASDGTQGDGESFGASISTDGRIVVFASLASNLVVGDTNNYCDTDGDGIYDDNCVDVFVHDRVTGETSRVSVASDGTEGNNSCFYYYEDFPSISADGHFVAFSSRADNLVAGDTNTADDIFVHDRVTGETARVSVASDGAQANYFDSWYPSISADGRFVAFHSDAQNLVVGDTNSWGDVFVHDRLTGETTRVSVHSDGMQGGSESWYPSISADGRFVAFMSFANLTEDIYGYGQIFVHDRETGETTLADVASDGTEANNWSESPSISGNGRYVAFESISSNLVPVDMNNTCDIYDNYYHNCDDVFVRDREAVGHNTISGRVTDRNGVPVEGVTISAGAWYSATTDAQGEYSIGEVFTDTYTLVPSLDSTLFTPFYRSVTLPPDAAGQDFIQEIPVADLGLRPNQDGYGFINETSLNQGDFNIPDLRRMFGDEAVCSSFAPDCTYTWQACLWKGVANQSMSAGRSDGMATTSLRFFKGMDTLPVSDTTFMLDPTDDVGVTWNGETFTTTVRQDIAFFSVEQLLSPVNEYKNLILEDTPTQVLSGTIAALSAGAPDPVALFIRPAPGAGGHTLTPYAVTDHGDGINWIWVYDSQHPYDAENPFDAYRYVIVDTLSDTWSYDLAGTTWSGDADSHTIGIVPISIYAQRPGCPWCVGQLSATAQADLWLSGGGHLLISDSVGNHLGYVGSDYVSEIPAAYGSFIDAGTLNKLEPIYTLPLSDTYSILLDGATLTQTSPASVAQFGPGYAVNVDHLIVGPSTGDHLFIANDGTQVGYHASQDQQPTLTLALDSLSANYGLSIRDVDIAAGQAITLTANTISGTLTLDGSGSSGGAYALSIRMVNSAGAAKFVHGNIPLLATDTHIIDFGLWDGSGTITLRIDHGSDGTVDETVELENQSLYFYIPLMIYYR